MTIAKIDVFTGLQLANCYLVGGVGWGGGLTFVTFGGGIKIWLWGVYWGGGFFQVGGE